MSDILLAAEAARICGVTQATIRCGKRLADCPPSVQATV